MSVWVKDYDSMLDAHDEWSMTLEKPAFPSIDDAIFCLLENIVEAKYHDKSEMAKAISYIAKERNIHQYSDFSEEDLEFYSLQDVLNMKKVQKEEQEDIKKRMLRNIKSLETQIYGKEEIDVFSVDGSLSNLSFHCGHYRTSNSNLNIKRKS